MWGPNNWKIERGCDFQLLLHLLDSVNCLPINISGASAINLLLKNADGTTLSVPAATGMAYGLGNALWIYGFPLTAVQTAALPLGSIGCVEVEVFWGTQVQKFMVWSALVTADPVI